MKGGIVVHDEILIELQASKERRGDCFAARMIETMMQSQLPTCENIKDFLGDLALR